MMTYLLDANVFIQAKNLHYGFDFCPAFWKWLEIENHRGKVFSVEKVGTELEAGADDLAAWAQVQGDGFFLPPDSPMLALVYSFRPRSESPFPCTDADTSRPF